MMEQVYSQEYLCLAEVGENFTPEAFCTSQHPINCTFLLLFQFEKKKEKRASMYV